MMDFLLTRILWLRRSKWQFLLAGLAFFIGLSTLMLAFESYLKITRILERQKQNGQYLILNKKISMANTMGFESGSFSGEEIDNIRKSGLFSETGEVHSNKFRAEITSTSYIQFRSLVFFESIPDHFLTNRPSDFYWDENRREVPVVVSQDFLNLYNFGFALGQGLPQVGRETLKLVTFDVIIDGPGGKEVLKGKVVGFTDRIASVLVPPAFLQWANREIGRQKSPSCTRVLVKVSNASDPAIGAFLKKHRLLTDPEKVNLGKSGSVLDLVMKGLTVLGLLFSLLALVMFSMNFRLVMAEAQPDIRLLIELGYSHRKIAFQLVFWFGLLLILVFAAALLVFSRTGRLLDSVIESQGLNQGFAGLQATAAAAGLLFAASVFIWNVLLIGRQLRKIA